MRYKLTIQYDGSGYHGWQKQPNEPKTIQRVTEDAAARVCGVPTAVIASGRTDEGVHALGQVAHFDSDKDLAAERFVAAFNHWLPCDVRVLSCERVPDSFDARKSAKRKTYEYRMYTAETGNTYAVENPLRRTRELFVPVLDVRAMEEAAGLFVGTHDFSAFMSSGSSAKTTVRTVYSAGVSEENGSVVFRVCGNGFLYNMVRIIAGALVRVGTGRMTLETISAALESGDRRLMPDVAPANALYLKNVEYSRAVND